MLKLLLLTSLVSSTSLVFLTHPLSMGLILMIQTILTSVVLGFFNLNFWYSYILYLVMIGGMLVLFIYMTSVASNEKFKFSRKLVITLSLLLMIIFSLAFMDPFLFNMNNLQIETLSTSLPFQLSLNKFVTYPLISIMAMLIIYLFITLVAVVKIVNLNSGPLRTTN
uniref:NADH-ubiquinone oxidoreductase chain 6 n=2 Tax=unclassified Hybosorus TaxID=2644960 RepID=A0A0S2MRF5_9SCAR|nr:NADH deshydrogenase subunit 6 [Hybosorus sp. HYB02]ALO77327.1 NADH deshydrogenase subunit 6 [Hybosorus sp. HYB01]